MNIVSPTLSMGLPIIAVPPAQPPQPYLRHGYGPDIWLEVRGFAHPSTHTEAAPIF